MDAERRRQAFAARLNAALRRANMANHSDGNLVKLLAREGVGTTSQSVSGWRNGKHMPRFDQLDGLAAMLEVDAGELAFGVKRVAESKAAYRDGYAEERALLQSFILLGEKERTLVRELINALIGSASQPHQRPGPRRRR